MSYPVTESDLTNGTPTGRIAPNGFVRGETWSDQIELDRELYGARFEYLTCVNRVDDANSSIRYYQAPPTEPDLLTTVWHVPCYGMLFQIPDVLPGSRNIRAPGTGTTPTTRGGLAFRAYAEGCLVEVGARHVQLDGTGGLAATAAWTTAQLDFTAAGFTIGTPGWLPNPANTNLLFPPAIGGGFVGPGDLIQYYVAFKHNQGATILNCKLHAYDLREPQLQSADP